MKRKLNIILINKGYADALNLLTTKTESSMEIFKLKSVIITNNKVQQNCKNVN